MKTNLEKALSAIEAIFLPPMEDENPRSYAGSSGWIESRFSKKLTETHVSLRQPPGFGTVLPCEAKPVLTPEKPTLSAVRGLSNISERFTQPRLPLPAIAAF